jgi:hypothetical protein
MLPFEIGSGSNHAEDNIRHGVFHGGCKRHEIQSPKRAPREAAQGRLPHNNNNNGSTIEFLRSQSLLHMVTGAAHRPY